MDWSRWFRHTFATGSGVRRAFPPEALGRIEAAVAACEALHSGEVRVAIEGALEPIEVARGKTPRARALEVFAALGVWDTDANNGVLVYVLLADRDVEIVADRGFNGRVSAAQWAAVCEDMQREFQADRYAAGVIAGVEDVGRIIGTHYPQRPGQRDVDELPNRPAVL
jgi:uncharacterized membrane protein